MLMIIVTPVFDSDPIAAHRRHRRHQSQHVQIGIDLPFLVGCFGKRERMMGIEMRRGGIVVVVQGVVGRVAGRYGYNNPVQSE